MRIEKINDRQIRCTLNQKDLSEREIGITELAYGTSKAKTLFRDMMQQASYEFGFDSDDLPLMIEAIPLLPEALILVITKIEEPDELDTRFSTFTEVEDWEISEDSPYDEDYMYIEDENAPELYNEKAGNHFSDESEWNYPEETSQKAYEFPKADSSKTDETDFISLPEVLGMEPHPKTSETTPVTDLVVIFSFPTLDAVTQLAYQIHSLCPGKNTLYKDSGSGCYYLVLHREKQAPDAFGKICNFIYEYGTPVKNAAARQHYMEEHFTPVISGNALSVLAKI
ncbi:MAG: adaptor protein MecA [Clostridiaceae bacterium]|nr:adaptor protein MecA [Clostridiaceae bacterium]